MVKTQKTICMATMETRALFLAAKAEVAIQRCVAAGIADSVEISKRRWERK